MRSHSSRAFALATCAATLLGGVTGLACATRTTIGDPVEGSPDPSGPRESAPVIISRSNRLAVIVRHAIEEADAIYESDTFWRLVAKRPWLTGPHGEVIDGAEVSRILRPAIPSQASEYDVTRLPWDRFTLGLWPGPTVASTATCGPVSIDERHVDNFSYLINTVAHENTHTVGEGRGTRGCDPPLVRRSRFTDEEHPPDLEVWLVSYGLGDLAQCYYLYKGDEEKVERCFSETVDGKHDDRVALECCSRPGRFALTLQRLRERSTWCAETIQAGCRSAKSGRSVDTN